MSNYWIAALLACAMLLPGCGSQAENTNTSPAADDPLEALQAEITDSGALVGVAFLGYGELRM